MLISTPGTVAAVAAFNLGEASEPGGGGLAASFAHESGHFGGGFDVSAFQDSLRGLSAGDPFASGGSDPASRPTPVEQGELARQADEIVVTARAGPVSDADIAAYDAEQASYVPADLDTIERPIDVRSFNSTNDLRAAEIVFEQRQAQTGRLPGDEAIEAGFDAEYARLDARAAIGNRLALDVVKSVVPPLDTAVAAYRVGVNGEYTLENGVTLGGSLLGDIGTVGGKLISGIGGDLAKGSVAAESAIAGGATNRTAFEVYKDGLRAGMERPFASDPKLSSILDDLYRPNAAVGSGSTAAAVRHELATGAAVGNKLHSQKAADSITALDKWLERNPTASPGDRAAAENVLRDTRNALGW